jgi:hypothetical protein
MMWRGNKEPAWTDMPDSPQSFFRVDSQSYFLPLLWEWSMGAMTHITQSAELPTEAGDVYLSHFNYFNMTYYFQSFTPGLRFTSSYKFKHKNQA